jgi:hypothetical protein
MKYKYGARNELTCFSIVQFLEILLPLAPLQTVLNGWMAQNVFAKLPRYSDGMHSRLCSALLCTRYTRGGKIKTKPRPTNTHSTSTKEFWYFNLIAQMFNDIQYNTATANPDLQITKRIYFTY